MPKFFQILFGLMALIAIVALTAGCGTIYPAPLQKGQGRTYESGQTVSVESGGTAADCDAVVHAAAEEGRALSKSEVRAVADCHRVYQKVSHDGRRQQALDHRERIALRRAAEREADARVRRAKSISREVREWVDEIRD